MNNVLDSAITKMRTKLETIPVSKQRDAENGIAIDFKDHFQYQQIQAHAHAMGKLSTRDAQICYIGLGEVWNENNGGFSKGTDLATKIIITQAISELLV